MSNWPSRNKPSNPTGRGGTVNKMGNNAQGQRGAPSSVVSTFTMPVVQEQSYKHQPTHGQPSHAQTSQSEPAHRTRDVTSEYVRQWPETLEVVNRCANDLVDQWKRATVPSVTAEHINCLKAFRSDYDKIKRWLDNERQSLEYQRRQIEQQVQMNVPSGKVGQAGVLGGQTMQGRIYGQSQPSTHPGYQDDMQKLKAHLQHEWERVKELEQQVVQQDEMIRELNDKVEDLSARNSHLMHGKMATDETQSENINIVNRPSLVVEEYRTLCTDQWLEAKQAMEDHVPKTTDQDQLITLGALLMESWNVAKTMNGRLQQQLFSLLNQPIDTLLKQEHVSRASLMESTDKSGGTEMGQTSASATAEQLDLSLRNAISGHQKTMSDKVDVIGMIQEVIINLGHSPQHKKVLMKPLVESQTFCAFMERACKVAWKMVIQQPPLMLWESEIGKAMKDTVHEQYWDCKKTSKSRVAFHVKPTLVHGDRVMVKGTVYLKD